MPRRMTALRIFAVTMKLMNMHRQIVLSLIAVLMASCNGTTNCSTCGPKSANLLGSVTGLVGFRLALQNGTTALNVSLNGTGANGSGIKFGTAPFNSNYNITVSAQPTDPSQTCVVANGAGSTGNSDVTNIAVTCTTNAPRFLYVANRGAGNADGRACDHEDAHHRAARRERGPGWSSRRSNRWLRGGGRGRDHGHGAPQTGRPLPVRRL